MALESSHSGMKWLLIPGMAFAFLFTLIIPAFYFALYRDDGTLSFPKRLRLLALVASFTTGVLMVEGLPRWIRSSEPYWAAMTTLDWRAGATSVLTLVRDPRTVAQISTGIGELFNIAYILLLVAIFRQETDLPLETHVPSSRLLNRATKVAVIAWGLVLLVVLLGLLLTPYNFYTLRNYAFQIGRTAPVFGDLLLSQIRPVLVQACLFAAPYIVYRSQRERAESPPDEQPGPELLESSG
ncbi:MAG TPA: hypothetical protein VLM42_01010 [Bryobacteraceae bacterium]|nr:hypothetical protein [Bryobacteraceae bacterium]